MKIIVLLPKVSLLLGALISCTISACGGGSSASPAVELAASSTYVRSTDLCSTTAPPPATVQDTATSTYVRSTSLCSTDLRTATPPPTMVQDVAIAGALADVRIENAGASDQTNVPVTFGQVFAQGDIPQLNSVRGKLSDGTTVPLQVDVKARHPDGSLRHGIISVVLPKLTLGQIQTIGLAKAEAASTPILANPVDVLNAGFTASVNIILGGQVYSASADALLKSGKYTTWLAGPVVTEWLVSAPLKTATGVAHPHLTARFAIRSFAGLNKASVDVTLENAWAYEPHPQNFTYDAQVLVGDKTVYSKPALVHYHHARWRKVFWWGSAPQVHLKHNTGYLLASKALPHYDQSIGSFASAIDAINKKFTGTRIEPMAPGLAEPYMPSTGGRPDIGLNPGWAVIYLLSMDEKAKAATLGTADLAGSWSVHYRDKNTDRPVSLLNYPYMSVNAPVGDTINPATKTSELFPACGGICANPNVADPAHQPQFAYLPYMLTGDYYYLEELQFWAMWNLFQGNPYYRNFAKGLFHRTQVRGQAWILRTLADAAYITPDSDSFKQLFATFLSNNLDWYNNAYTNNASADNRLGFITEYGIEYNNQTAMAPWMDDFFTSAVGHAAELGYAKAQPLLAWKIKFPISRILDPDFCWILGASYSLPVRSDATSPIYTTIAQVYRAAKPANFTALTCAGSEMAASLGLRAGEMTGYASSTVGMPSDMQPALAYASDWGGANGVAAWKIFDGRSVKPNYSTGPQFAITPR